MGSLQEIHRKHPNFWFGVAFVAFACVIFTQTFGLPPSIVPNSIGAAFFPRLLMIAIFLLGIGLAAEKGTSEAVEDTSEEYGSYGPPLFLFGLMWVFIIIVPYVGYYIANILMLSGTLYAFGERKLWVHAITVIGVLIFTYYVFDRTFGVLFPGAPFLGGH